MLWSLGFLSMRGQSCAPIVASCSEIAQSVYDDRIASCELNIVGVPWATQGNTIGSDKTQWLNAC
eukprot:6175295-Pleurochrysis_carterae.AAC.10